MKLYMKEKVFSWTDQFTVKDAEGRDKYFVEGEFLSWGKKLHVRDAEGREVAFIKQEVLTLMPRYYVFVDGQQVAEIVKAFTLFRPKYRIDGLGWEIEGEFTHHNYLITKHDQTIVSIDKEWMTWGDCYELNIKNDTDEIVALAVVLTIDCVTESSSSGVSISFDL